MKNFNSVFLSLIASVFFTSCTDEPIDPVLASQITTPTSGGSGGTGGSNGAIFKVDFNGQTWTSSIVGANIYNGKIELAASKGALGESFGFSLNGTTSGTYTSSTNLIAYNAPNSSESYIAYNPNSPTTVAGSVIVTNIDATNNTISGTFSFTGYWADFSVSNIPPIVFTNGVFTNIPYTTTNPNTDTFYAKSDGTEFVENTIDVSETSSSGFPDSYSIVASRSNGDNIGFSIDKNLPVGTYQMAGPFGQQINSACLFGGVLYNGDTGSITITSKTATQLVGTFSYVVKNFTTNQTKAITQGAFSVELP